MPLEVAFWTGVRTRSVDILSMFDHLPWFRGAADWSAWRALLCATYGLPMSQREYDTYRLCTGRKDPPKSKVDELWMVVGRRGRKSAIMATIGVYEAGWHEHDSYLAPGELCRVPIMSKSMDDASQIHRYARAILAAPGHAFLLAAKERQTTEVITLTNRAEIVIRAASITGGRTFAVRAALLDEQAFWSKDEAAQPDVEVLRGLAPSMANVPGHLTVGASSPYDRKGLLYQKHHDFYGVENDSVLVWQANTLLMHDTPAIRDYVQKAWAADPTAAASEVGGLEPGVDIRFRTDIEDYWPPELTTLNTDAVLERAPQLGVQYVAFADPSGGSADSFTLCIAHYDQRQGKTVVDLIDETPSPCDPDVVTEKHCALLRKYRVRKVTGDAYAGEWPRSAYQRGSHAPTCPRRKDKSAACRCEVWRVEYVVSEWSKSELYVQLLPIARSGRVRLVQNAVLKRQLEALERKPYRGHEVVDHPQGTHDDVANAVAGAVVHADAARANIREELAPPVDNVEAHNRKLWEAVKEDRREVHGLRRKGRRPRTRGGLMV